MFRLANPVIPVKIIDDRKAFQCSIDQFDSQDFNKNEAGWIRNDISQLARATSQSQYDAIMRRLVELKQEGGIDEKTSIDEAISMIKPRYAQSPNEIQQFIELTNGNVMDKVTAAYKEALKDVHPDKKVNSSSGPSLEPSSEPSSLSD